MEKKTKLYYVAFDGTEFDDEEECAAYENAFQSTKGVVGFNDHKKAASTAEEVATEAVYLFITDANDARHTFYHLTDYYGTDFPTKFSDGDFLRWDDDNDCWVNMLDEFNKLGDIIATMANHIKESAKNDTSIAMQNAWTIAWHRICYGCKFDIDCLCDKTNL
jgi:hypothetical protein